MAGAIGLSGIHNVTGICDLCGEKCDPNKEDLNALDCTYKDCPSMVYHQSCLERYLKSIRLEKNRKTGFKCPRGCGKRTQFLEPCRGKVDKSHPIHVRHEQITKPKFEKQNANKGAEDRPKKNVVLRTPNLVDLKSMKALPSKSEDNRFQQFVVLRRLSQRQKMGSLLPGWDSDRTEESVGIKQELQTEKEFLEYQKHGGREPTIGGRKSIGGREPMFVGRKSIEDQASAMAPVISPPSLSRKSAPSSIVIEQLMKEEELSIQKQQKKDNITKTTKELYSRDKWWRKFSSANLNDLANDVEKQYGKDTYVPQFDIAGGDHYTKQK